MAAGWHLAKLSLRVVRSDASLSVLVVLGGVAASAVALAFLIPALLAHRIEENVLAALDRSASLFRERWGEQLAGTASIGLLFALLGAVPAVLLLALGLASGSTGVVAACVALAVVVAVAAAVLGSAARAVFAVALYRYASGSDVTGPFSALDLEGAVARKRA